MLTTLAVLQIRAFAYQDTQRYRLGPNFYQLPVNRPKNSFNPLHRDGAGNSNGLENTPSYFPSTFQDYEDAPQYAPTDKEKWCGPVVDHESKLAEDDFAQPRDFWVRILPKDAGQQENLVGNIAEHLAQALPEIRKQTYGMFRCPN